MKYSQVQQQKRRLKMEFVKIKARKFVQGTDKKVEVTDITGATKDELPASFLRRKSSCYVSHSKLWNINKLKNGRQETIVMMGEIMVSEDWEKLKERISQGNEALREELSWEKELQKEWYGEEEVEYNTDYFPRIRILQK
jgi:hypothetical protein